MTNYDTILHGNYIGNCYHDYDDNAGNYTNFSNSNGNDDF